jgi:hypothetical protein
MGLTIHWQLQGMKLNEETARAAIASLRQRALDLPLEHVGEIVELAGEACEFDPHTAENPHGWLLLQAGRFVELPDERGYRSVTPERLVAFSTSPGAGCEEANFGLCLYPETISVADPDREGERTQMPTGAAGWCWSSCCKTQYASDPACGGVDNFVRSHLNVVQLLEHARTLGILESVHDESEFWDNRNLEALVGVVGKWNQMTAGFVGQLKDWYGDQFTAAITNFSNFEHLEAEGRRDE